MYENDDVNYKCGRIQYRAVGVVLWYMNMTKGFMNKVNHSFLLLL